MHNVLYISDEALLAKIRDEDDASLATLYKLYYPMALNLILNNNGSEDEAKDIFQEAIIAFYESLRKEDFVLNCKIKTYLYSICRRLWLKQLSRKTKFTDSFYDYEPFIDVANELTEATEKETQFHMMEKALIMLGEPCKSLIEGFYIDGSSMQALTEKFGYTNSDNAKTQKYKCLTRLKRFFFSMYNNDDE